MIFKLGELERGRRWANPRKEIRKHPERVRNDVQDELRETGSAQRDKESCKQ